MSMKSKKIKHITQENFPGSIIEPEWSIADTIDKAPYYALRLACKATVQISPRGNKDFVSMHFDGTEYIIHIKNFEKIQQLQEEFVTAFLIHKGYPIGSKTDSQALMRYNPNLLIDSIQFLNSRAKKTFSIPAEKTRVYWPLQDDTACTYYRSTMPFAYMQTMQERFYSEASRFFSHNSLSYFDAIWINRAPSGNVMAIVESVRRDQKVLIYESDDNLFDIPEWNPAFRYYTEDIKRQIRESMARADFCVATNEYLADVLYKNSGGLPTMIGPNLLDMNEYTVNVPGRELSPIWNGYQLTKDESERPFFSHASKPAKSQKEMSEDNYDPIRILWAGSPTHEFDLDQIIEPLRRVGQRYGIAVRFMFQNYIPNALASAYAQPGTGVAKIDIAEEYEGFVSFIPAVKSEHYQRTLAQIKADFAICPLTDHQFNLSKSSIKPLEMAACGIPSIVSDYGPYEFIKHGHDGLKVKVNDTDGWYDCLCRLIEDKEYRLQLGRNALETVTKEWSWQYDSENRRKWDAIFDNIEKLVASRKEKIRSRALSTYAIIDNDVEQARYEQIREEKTMKQGR